MCGITLVVSKNKQTVDRACLEQANQALHHRGPDDSQIFCHQNIGLGYNRLSIVDIAGGQQPFFNEDRSVILICNGEIYNYRSLRDSLIAKGHTFNSHSDCEVILHLYEENREGYVEQLEGMFAFVLVDLKNETIDLCRDRFGMKPLFYFEDKEFLICSSEIKGILATGLTPRQLDHQSIFDLFTLNYLVPGTTCFQGIEDLAPANLRRYSLREGSIQDRSYWEPFFPDAGVYESIIPAVYSPKMKNTLSESVATHLIGDVPIGVYLSGGIDSSVITMLLHEQMKGSSPLTSYSIRFQEEKELDESFAMNKMIEKFHLNARFVDAKKAKATDLDLSTYYNEFPCASPINTPLIDLSKLVRDDGGKVVLCGEGSDEIFGGYSAFQMNQINYGFNFLPHFVKKWVIKKIFKQQAPNLSFMEILTNLYVEDRESIIEQYGTFPAWYPFWALQNSQKCGLFLETFPDTLSKESRFYTFMQKLKPKMENLDPLNQSLLIELKTRLPNWILNRADRNSMAHSVEARIPFLNTKFYEEASQVPHFLKLFLFNEKYLLKTTFANDLPKEITERRKQGFRVPSTWLWRTEDSFRDSLMSAEALSKTNIFNPKKVEELINTIKDPSSPIHEIEASTGMLNYVLTTQLLYNQFCSPSPLYASVQGAEV